MANNKFSGYNPKKEETTSNDGIPGSGTLLDQVNPFEFRKGMDYELTELGCSRLQESTPEEREKATETVLKNLNNTHPSYYSALIQFERGMDYGGSINEKSFKKYIKTYTSEEGRGDGMKEIQNSFKSEKMKDATHKNDKMTEPKYDKKEHTIPFKGSTEQLKEAIKKQIKNIIKEQEDFDDDEKSADKEASKGAKKLKSGNRFDLEKEAIKDLLYRGSKGKESEFTEEEPSPKSILATKDEMLQTYKTKFKGKDGGLDNYNEELKKANEKFLKLLEKHIKTFGEEGKGNNVTIKDVYGEKLPDTIKLLGARLKQLEKEEEEDLLEKRKERNEVAQTGMTREQHIKLLEIIRENGVSLREGAAGIKSYYEIAKSSYLEGLSNGLGL